MGVSVGSERLVSLEVTHMIDKESVYFSPIVIMTLYFILEVCGIMGWVRMGGGGGKFVMNLCYLIIGS